jgi:hypothetical protein
MNKMRELRDIPNSHNFEFVGITKDNQKIDCRVLFDGKNHSVYKENPYGKCFNMLIGWEFKKQL